MPVDWGSDWSDQNTVSSASDPIAAGGMSIADFNGDGRHDIFLPQVGADQLYIAQSDGTMADESSERLPAGLDSASTAGIAFDADGDGDEDLLITRRVGGLSLLINDGEGNFSDGTDAAGLVRRVIQQRRPRSQTSTATVT